MKKFIFNLKEKKEKFDYRYLEKILEQPETDVNEQEREYLFKWIVFRVEEFLSKKDMTYSCLCGEAADLACALLDTLCINHRQVNLKKLLNEILNVHAITIVYFGRDSYIIDPTFRQFLVLDHCIPGLVKHFNSGVIYHVPCYPGYFLSLTENGKKFGEDLLNKGFFKVTDENLKLYCDSFVSYYNSIRQRDFNYNLRSSSEYKSELYSLETEKSDIVDSNIKLTPSELLEKNKILKKRRIYD